MNKIVFFNTFSMRKMIFSGLLGLVFLSPVAVAEIKGFQDFNGKSQKLENHLGKGKWLIAMIWASDCHICNREAHQYVDFHMIHSDTDATVLGISVDGKSRKKEAVKFIKKHSIDFLNLIAEPSFVSNLYKNLSGQYFAGTPSFLIFSPKGELKAAQAGAVPTELIEEFMKQNTIVKADKK